MKIHLIIISVSLFLALGTYAVLAQVSAQDGVYDSDTGAAPQPGGAIVDDTTDTAPAGSTVAENAFNPLWILPIIAVPLLIYLFWPRKREQESMELGPDFAGAKGGRAKSDDNAADHS